MSMRTYWLASTLCVLFLLYVFTQFYLNVDSAWLVLLAEQVAAGKTLYVDVSETNPPLIVWLHMPAIWLHKLSGLGLQSSWVIWVCVLYAYSIFMIGRMSHLSIGMRLLIVFLIGPGFCFQFSQREHLFFLMCLPYCVSLLGKEKPGTGPAFIAAVGSMIKPFYLLVPLLFMLWRAAQKSQWLRGFFILPNWVFALTCLAYIGWLIGVETAYVQRMVPLLREFYGSYTIGAQDMVYQFVYLPLILLIPWLFWMGFELKYGSIWRKEQLWFLLFVSCWVAAVVQQKAWSNHMHPLLISAAILHFAILLRILPYQEPLLGKIVLVWVGVFLIGGGGLKIGSDYWKIMTYRYPAHSHEVVTQSGYCESKSVFGTGFNLPSAHFPAILACQQQFTAPYAHLWFLPQQYLSQVDAEDAYVKLRIPEHMHGIEKQAYMQSVRAFVESEPDWLVVENRSTYLHPEYNHYRFDFLAYFRQDSAFDAAFASYKKAFETEHADYYRRQ